MVRNDRKDSLVAYTLSKGEKDYDDEPSLFHPSPGPSMFLTASIINIMVSMEVLIDRYIYFQADFFFIFQSIWHACWCVLT